MRRTESWTVGRLWSTAGVLHASPLPAGTLRILIGAEGEALLELEDESFALRRHQMIIFDGNDPLTTRNRDIWARYEWHLQAAALREVRFAPHLARPLDIQDGYYELFATLSNTISTGHKLDLNRGGGLFLEALINLVTAAMLESANTSPALSSTQSELFIQATTVIEERYREDSFSVTDLANALSISKNYLYRVFATAGSSPRLAIEARRVFSATSLLDFTPVRGSQTLKDIARRSGFTSVRRMQAAITRQRERTMV